MRPVVRLATTMSEFEGVHSELDRVKRGKSVSISKDALAHLLIDHTSMLNVLREHGRVEYRGNEDKRDADES